MENLKQVLLQKDLSKLQNQCMKSPKLRTYNLISDFPSENCYLTKPLSFVQRRAIAKLRLGVLGLRIETGRFERPKKSAAERICKQCDLNVPESEIHFFLHCPKHTQLRTNFFAKITSEEITNLSDLEQLKFLVNNPTMVKSTAQLILNCYDNRIIE